LKTRKRPRIVVCVVAVATIVILVLAALALLLRGPVVLRTPAGFEARPVSAERLERDVRHLCTAFGHRSYVPPENLGRVADWIRSELEPTGLEVREQSYTIREGTYRNVIATRRGTDPSAGVVVIGAHYDAYGEMPGADDNASGVAVLLELARTLDDRPTAETRHLVFFVNEEPPFFAGEDQGSRHFALELLERGTPVDLMVALDLVGYFSDESGSQTLPSALLRLYYPSRGDFIGVVGDTRSGRWIHEVKRGMRAARSIPVLSFRGPRWIPGVDWSDHFWFRELGLPGVLVSDTAMLRNPNYHRRTDTPDTLDYPRMAGVVQALHGLLQTRRRDGGR
jgi:hypothetical protein